MKSGWFFGTEEWQRYLVEYAKYRPECLREWKSSPLADDHIFYVPNGHLDLTKCGYSVESHQTQVLDLRTHKWSDVRKSYHSIIHRGHERLEINEDSNLLSFRLVHHWAFGAVRSGETFAIQQEWLKSGNAMALGASDGNGTLVASVLWIIYQGCAYYASAPSLEKNTMHAVIWKSLQLLKARGVTLVELGQIDGETEKEKGIARFKMGWGGEAKPFTVVRRLS